MKITISILLFSLVILNALPQIAIAETKKSQVIISFGVGPQQSASELAKTWTPFLSHPLAPDKLIEWMQQSQFKRGN